MTEGEETRYARQVRINLQRDRHTGIIGKLTAPIVDEFDAVMEDFNPECRRQGIPSKWTDWDSVKDHREPTEGERPDAQAAWDLCEGCPIAGQRGVCYRYAEITGQAHGVWGGYRRENGKWVVGFE